MYEGIEKCLKPNPKASLFVLYHAEAPITLSLTVEGPHKENDTPASSFCVEMAVKEALFSIEYEDVVTTDVPPYIVATAEGIRYLVLLMI